MLNLKSTVDVLPYLVSTKNIEFFAKNKIFTEKELRARCEIAYENYDKTVNIEANTMLAMAKDSILPVVMQYIGKLLHILADMDKLGMNYKNDPIKHTYDEISLLFDSLYHSVEKLDEDMHVCPTTDGVEGMAIYMNKTILPDMSAVREYADKLEVIVDASYWPYPKYSELMFDI